MESNPSKDSAMYNGDNPSLRSEFKKFFLDKYCVKPTVTWDLGFSGLIQRTAPFSRLLRHTWGCGGSILNRIFKGCQSRCDTIKIPPTSKALNAEHRPKFYSPISAVVTSPYE
jgi:hypothetical protein